ncbi:hypothetical protein Q8F55_006907 [Vanrija albida]|uniref:Carboxylic ester hydrolase n=1 Tax=Vanrija albida TaxID=181172 RepID=A0ABR3PYE9_9TREE
MVIRPITIDVGPHGKLRGVEAVAPDGHVKARRFLQVPYAYPPVGDLRWRKPKALPEDYDWSNVPGEKFGAYTSQPTYHMTNPDTGVTFPSAPAGLERSEDALTVNVWAPTGTPPPEGWPVWIYIHGGWLQMGNPAMSGPTANPTEYIDEVAKVVVIAIAYRVSVFGFLASKELREENEDGAAGNWGFHDQRLGIEWVHKNAHYFGGNGDNITIAGISAGSYSVEVQLAYELNFPDKAKPIVRRAMMWSNALPAQPKSLEESQAGFDGLCEAFGIDLALSGKEKLQKLRAIPEPQLVDQIMKLKIHTFRGVSDNAFIHEDMFERIASGDFAKRFAARDLALIIGEVTHEEYLYSVTNPPTSVDKLEIELLNYYRAEQVAKLLEHYNIPKDLDTSTKEGAKKLALLFGNIVANGQIYASERVFIKALLDHGVSPARLLRYRVAWKPAAAFTIFPPEIVTHADDTWAWWYSRRLGYTDADAASNQDFLKPVATFLQGDVSKAAKEWWGHEPTPEDGQRLREIRGGKTSVVQDDRWDAAIKLAAAVQV